MSRKSTRTPRIPRGKEKAKRTGGRRPSLSPDELHELAQQAASIARKHEPPQTRSLLRLTLKNKRLAEARSLLRSLSKELQSAYPLEFKTGLKKYLSVDGLSNHSGITLAKEAKSISATLTSELDTDTKRRAIVERALRERATRLWGLESDSKAEPADSSVDDLVVKLAGAFTLAELERISQTSQ